MTTITSLAGTDGITAANSMVKINTNFTNLNADKIETSYLDTDTSLTANSDVKIPTQKAVRTYVNTVAATTFLVPSGAILPYGGANAPSNYLMCDGTAVSRATYNTLFTIIGTTYGVGDGTNTFNLPNLRNRIPLGAGTGTKVATFVSRATNVITVSGLSDAANNEFQTGKAVVYSTTGAVITGLTNNTTYFVVRVSNTTFYLAATLADAQNGTVIALTGDGTGTQTFTHTFTTRTLGHSGGEENHAMSSTELLAHTHTLNNASNLAGAGSATAQGGSAASGGAVTANSTGGNVAMNILNPFVVVNYIIKT